jgi:hypothetical protein
VAVIANHFSQLQEKEVCKSPKEKSLQVSVAGLIDSY